MAGGGDLDVPLARSQVEAATLLYHRHCELWRTTDEALESLSKSFPGFDRKSCLLKVAAVNSLYGTNIYAVARMAQHVEELMRARASLSEDVDLVEHLASPPRLKLRFYSFASKFAHFFIDAERFPIYDSYAVAMVTYHLGKAGGSEKEHRYRWFVADFFRLKESLGFPVTTRELDQYLWLAGEYRAWKGLSPWKKTDPSIINSELRGLFEASTEDASTLLRDLLGSSEQFVGAKEQYLP